MNKRIIIAGGGTGGHIFPAIAIANALKKHDPGNRNPIYRREGKNGNGESAAGRV